MAKLETAAQFISLMKEGKYESKVNAQRAAGRTRLSDAEKQKAFAAIDAHFGGDAAAAPAKKTGKKKAAKKASKKVTAKPPAETSGATPFVAPAPAAKKAKKKAAKKASKKVARRAAPPTVEAAAPGTLPMSPSEVNSVADVLKVIDSTVAQSVGIMNALQRADEINKSGDISEGVKYVKSSLVGAAQLLQESVVDPLRKAGSQTDAEVASRLQRVVESTSVPFHQDLVPSTMEQLPPPMQNPNSFA
jgi:hypothetical protein